MSFFEGFRRGRAEAHAVISVGDGGRMLTMVQDFFRDGANWTQGAYHRANGTKCLIGAIEHLGARKAITQAQSKEWIRIAIRESGADSPGLFGGFMCIEHFNDTRGSYVEVAEVLARARVLAVAHARQMASELRLTAARKEAARLPVPKIPAPPPTLALPYEARIEPDLRTRQPVPVAKQKSR